ncbi:MAG: bifunctional 3-phosphoshikimate 1-carboxyvinyltransferase/cytidylate kinase [Rhodocyclaceae bacterium]|nr:bifunctional 3-phosphoshikimate 1-carboxyvinyltransferase/cytidylate kinase [Rhodocyclaceae bacterium]
MEYLDLAPAYHASGSVRLPGSKSISNRFLLLAALAEGETAIRDLLLSDDIERMLEALKALGNDWKRMEGNDFRVRGAGGAFPVKQAELFLGNAGTAFRPLTAALALSNGHYRLTGVPRMHERPIGDLVDALRQLGADIRYLGKEGFPPLEIRPSPIRAGGRVTVRGEASSQFLTALLMALPLNGDGATVEVLGELVSKPYIDITLKLMARFGVKVERDGWREFRIPSGMRYRSPGTVFVEGDASSASYFLAAGAVAGGPVRVEGVGRDSIQGDVRFAEALQAMGAHVEMGPNWIEAAAPAGGRLQAIDLDCNHIPDAAMTLAVVALFAEGTTRLTNIASWRVKETDRIAAMATELRKLGAQVEEGTDFIAVSMPGREAPGAVPQRLTFKPNAAIDTYDDHRMAMCFSLACLRGVPVRINDPKCVNKTFPEYFDRFLSLLAPVIAIDGPSASGKGTVAALVAEKLGFHYLDSGALYRLVALAALRAGVALDDGEALARIAETLPAAFEGGRILLDGEESSAAIRSEACSAGASKVAAFPAVRAALLGRQRAYRQAPGLVAEGRDMGSVVFPDAPLKVFLSATAEARAERRHKQLIDKGMSANIDTLLQDLHERDARDSARAVAPLQKCADAELLDTTAMTVDEAVAWVIERVRQRLPHAAAHS